MNTKILLPLLLGTACLMASCRNQEMIPVDEISSLAVKQCTIMEQSLTEDTMPRNFQNGELVLSDTHWWCSGFFPGVCWYTYKLSGEEAMKEMALKESAKLLDVSGLSGDHDLGFQVLPSSGEAYAETGDTLYLKTIRAAATELAARKKEANRRGTARRKAHMEELKVRSETDPAAAEELAAIRAYNVQATTKSRNKLIEDAKTDPEAAKKLAGKRERRNQNHRQKRQALIKLAETDPAAAARLAEIRAGEVRKQQEYMAKLQEQAKTDPEAAARWEAHQEYVRNYNHNYRARKQAEAAGKELMTI